VSTKPRKPPIDPVRWQPPPVDPLPDFPAPAVTVVPLPGNGPEDVVVDSAGQLWAGLEDGRIVRVPADGGDPVVVADTGGRPLGLHVARDGRVLVCDSHRGLLALDPASGGLATLVDSVEGRRLKFCSNVTETGDGTIYFTESTSRFHFEDYTAPIVEARGTGSLFRLGADGSTSTLLRGLYFANGVTPTADGSALVFAETVGRRLSKYWLSGPKAGTAESLAVNLPGMPDNLSAGADGRIWCAFVASANAALEPRAPLDSQSDVAAARTAPTEDRTGDLGCRLRSGHRPRRRGGAHDATRLWSRDRCRRDCGTVVDVDHQLPRTGACGSRGDRISLTRD
jgi:sugar lactone lactonase YvrE